MIKIETKTETFCKNSIITFLNPVHIVPLSQVRFKLEVRGGGDGTRQKIKEFYLFLRR